VTDRDTRPGFRGFAFVEMTIPPKREGNCRAQWQELGGARYY